VLVSDDNSAEKRGSRLTRELAMFAKQAQNPFIAALR
jgi:hypothetical protein